MNIHTLTYIHRILQADVAQREEVYNNAHNLAREYERKCDACERKCDACERDGTGSHGLRKLAAEQMEASDEFRAQFIEAQRALRDFEQHEWD